MAGANAVMAVTPQMDVPAVKSKDISLGRPAQCPYMGMSVNPAPTEASTMGNPADPVVTSSTKDSLAATATMPPCKMVLVAH
jgi:hypothetical protein